MSHTAEVCWYQDANGNELDLSTKIGIQYKAGIEGRYAGPVKHISTASPLVHGERYETSIALTRQLQIPMIYEARDRPDLRRKLRGIVDYLDNLHGVGELHVITEDGLHRYATCIYEDGFSGSDTNDDDIAATVVHVFRVFDPFWYDADLTTVIKQFEEEPGSTWPAPPFDFGPAEVLAAFAHSYDGTADTWPIWTIAGPGNALNLINSTSQQVLTLSYTIPSGGMVTIDTRPGYSTIRNQSGANLIPYMSGSFWPLIPGDNALDVQLANAQPGASITMTYRSAWRGT